MEKQKENISSISKLEEYFEKRLLSKNKSSRIKLNSIDNYPKIRIKKLNINTNIQNLKPGIINFNNKAIQNSLRQNTNFFTNNPKPKIIICYTDRYDPNKYKYNNIELKNDLKRYTNNSSTFKYFDQLNKNYHPYSAHRAIKSMLFNINTERKKEVNKNIYELNNIEEYINKSIAKKFENEKILEKKTFLRNNYFNKASRTFKNKFSRKFSPLSSIQAKLSKYDKNNNKNKDVELMDNVDEKIFENEKLKKAIKHSLINDINHDEINYKLFSDYSKSMINRINFIEDINVIPHIKNNLSLSKPFDNLVLLGDKLKNKNFLHRQVAFSMNKICIIKMLLKKEREMTLKKLKENIEYKSKKKWYNKEDSFEKKLNQFEAKFNQFELNDYFGKCINYTFICFADQKVKDCIFSKNFSKIKIISNTQNIYY